MTPARVLLTADTVGGVWSFALELARGLRAHDVRVALACLGLPDAGQRRAAAAIPGLRLYPIDSKLEWMSTPWDDLARAGARLQTLAREFEADLVHLNHYVHGNLDFGVPVVVSAHSCVLSWFDAVHGQPAGQKWSKEWSYYRRAVTRGLAGADAVTAPTAAMARAVDRHYAPPVPVQVVGNGRDPADFAAAAAQPRILAVGRLWDPAKNLEMLARCAPRLDWPVRLIGAARGPEGQAPALQQVECRGHMGAGEIAAEFASAGIYALPARYEPFGLSVLEAALSGCALVLGDIPSLRELWHGAALFVDPEDDDALAGALQSLIVAPDARRAWAARAYRRAGRFSAAAMTAGYLSVYRALTGVPLPATAATR